MTALARIEYIEGCGRIALPALEDIACGDWVVRLSGGATKRVNSANAVRAGAVLETVRAVAERSYRLHGLPCRFRLTPLADPGVDAALAAEGYTVVDPSVTMTCDIVDAPMSATATITTELNAGWAKASQRLQNRSDEDSVVQARLLAAIPGPLALASTVSGNEIIASAYASIGHDCAQISDVVVAPGARGKGLGRAIVASLLGWARTHGCRQAMLQVLANNDPARHLYRSLGFTDAYPYHYRVRQ